MLQSVSMIMRYQTFRYISRAFYSKLAGVKYFFTVLIFLGNACLFTNVKVGCVCHTKLAILGAVLLCVTKFRN